MRETPALPRARAREFLSVFGVANFPAQRGNLIAQFVASLPIFFASRLCTLLRPAQLATIAGDAPMRLAAHGNAAMEIARSSSLA